MIHNYHVGGDGTEKVTVVTNDNHGQVLAFVTGQVLLQPYHAMQIQMIGNFI